jgi:hypothetical protein
MLRIYWHWNDVKDFSARQGCDRWSSGGANLANERNGSAKVVDDLAAEHIVAAMPFR